MIKVDKFPEMSEGKSDVSKGYLNIKPVESMTKQEAFDFIAAEFQKAHDEAEIALHDKLLSEIFNRSEDELHIDFSLSDQILSALEKFKSEDWGLWETKERMDAVRNLAKAIGKELQLDKLPEIELMSGKEDDYGAFNVGANKITLNDKYFDNPSELVNTIAHELRHAYQHMRTEILDTWEDALYKVNFDNYISPLLLPGGGYLFFTDYQDQYVEVDARAFANLFTEAMR